MDSDSNNGFGNLGFDDNNNGSLFGDAKKASIGGGGGIHGTEGSKDSNIKKPQLETIKPELETLDVHKL